MTQAKSELIRKALLRYLGSTAISWESNLLNMQERIVARLTEGLDPLLIEIVDESDRHAGHAGARAAGGTHYRVKIVSRRFSGLNRVARHRLVYDFLPAEFADGLHALALDARAPNEP